MIIPPTASYAVRRPAQVDFDGWATLFRSYRHHEHLVPDEDVVRRVWVWINDAASGFDAFVAAADDRDEVVGLVHYRSFHRPLSGTIGLYVDNVMADPHWRRLGVAQELLTAVVDEATSLGYPLVRWMAAEANLPARTLYDRIVDPAPWIVYDVDPRVVMSRGGLLADRDDSPSGR